MASEDRPNWYETDDIIECNRQMLEQQFACDVHFVVGEERERQGAHRYMLVSRSPVFAAMFHGSWHEPSDKDIEVPDVEPAAFRQLLRSARISFSSLVNVFCGSLLSFSLSSLSLLLVDLSFPSSLFPSCYLLDSCLSCTCWL